MINLPESDQEITWNFSDQNEVIQFEEGLSNCTYLLVHEGRKYVVRDFHLKKNVSDAFRELWMMQLAAELGIAPKIEHIDLKKGYVVIDYIEGHHPGVSCHDLKHAVRQLRKFHEQTNYEPFSSIYVQYASMKTDDLTEWNQAISIVKEIEALIKNNGCTYCHLDFHTKNIIQGNNGAAWIIDWESSGLAHPFYDVAKLTHSLSFEEALKLLAEYLETNPTDSQIAQFFLLRSIVYMSIATNRYSRGEIETAKRALNEFLDITASDAFRNYLR